ncbi:MAG: hypothetical protein AAB853_06015, partial [Patescibacteria group bacterium]
MNTHSHFYNGRTQEIGEQRFLFNLGVPVIGPEGAAPEKSEQSEKSAEKKEAPLQKVEDAPGAANARVEKAEETSGRHRETVRKTGLQLR